MDFRTDPKPRPQGRRPAGLRRFVRCAVCERVEEVSAQDLAGYMQTGWPRCCREVMTYYSEADPEPDDHA
jgi:hypothetical protein